MVLLIDSPSFTANEVYEIQATDAVEGAATGASFGGLGLSNQPHQQLANRTAFLKQRQDTNIGNISALQSFTALFKGQMSANGYAQVPFLDVNRGLITATIQWGASFPYRWPRKGSDLRGDVADSIPQRVRVGDGVTIEVPRRRECGKLVMETVGFTTATGDLHVGLHFRRDGCESHK